MSWPSIGERRSAEVVTSASRRGLPLAIDQNSLLPPAWSLIGPMDAAGPAARPLLPLQQFLARSRDAPLAGRSLLGVIDPADEFVSAKGRQAFPQCQHRRVTSQRNLKIVGRFVHGAMEKSVSHKYHADILRTKSSMPIGIIPSPSYARPAASSSAYASAPQCRTKLNASSSARPSQQRIIAVLATYVAVEADPLCRSGVSPGASRGMRTRGA